MCGIFCLTHASQYVQAEGFSRLPLLLIFEVATAGTPPVENDDTSLNVLFALFSHMFIRGLARSPVAGAKFIYMNIGTWGVLEVESPISYCKLLPTVEQEALVITHIVASEDGP